jgi:predicted nucleic acid-binding protein
MKRSIVLDSFALLSFFHKEPGWETVRDILRDLSAAGDRALLCRINWGEFYYIVRRRLGRRKAEEALVLLEQLPIDVVAVDDELVKEAAEIKADYPVAYEDAFCIATAMRANGRLFTGDPEFGVVERLVDILWLSSR